MLAAVRMDGVRKGGVVDTARGLTAFGHLCWAYRSRSEFRARVAEYIADGVASGQWVEYVGAGEAGALRDELRALPGIPDALDEGRIGVSTVRDFYRFIGDTDVVDAEATVAVRLAAAERKLQEGHAGFRAVVDATAVVRSPSQREAFARFEYLTDREMRLLPASALCAYDARELGIAAVSELACLHPFVNEGATPFRLYAEEDVDFGLAGEIDVAAHALLDIAARRVVGRAEDARLTVDGRALEFIDHRGLCVLERHAREQARGLVLRTCSPTVARMAELLDFSSLRVQLETAQEMRTP